MSEFEWDIGTVMLAGYDADGHPHLQPDAFGEEKSGVDPVSMQHFFGFLGLPPEPQLDPNGQPIPNKAAQTLFAWEGHSGHAFALSDTRLTLKLPRLALRGSIQYGGNVARPAFSMIDGASGSYQLYVPYAFTGEGESATPSKACTIGINVRNAGAESMEIVHGEGMAITLLSGSVTIKNAGGNVSIEVGATGVTINGNLVVNGSIQFGGAAGAVPVMLAGMVPSTMMQGR